MHENEISEKIIGAAIDVHRYFGPGLLKSVYEEALCHELHLRGISFLRQQKVPIAYKGIKIATDFRLDLLVEDKVIVEAKAKEELSKIDKPQLLTYLKLCDKHLGLIINFHVELLRNGQIAEEHIEDKVRRLLRIMYKAGLFDESVAAYETYPGQKESVNYAEGLFVGYRFFDKRQLQP